MPRLPFDSDRVVRLLARDLAQTLGRSPEAEEAAVRDEVVNIVDLAQEWLAWVPTAEDPEPALSPAEVQARYEQAVVDEVQQGLHDTHAHTTWPSCPRHQRHPLWYDQPRDAWCCPLDQAVVVPLGGLGSRAAV